LSVWQKTGILAKYRGTQLFGLEHQVTQMVLRQLQRSQVPSCKPSQWNDKITMNALYEYHLKRRTMANINWLDLFTQWADRENNIIEMNMSLAKLYPPHHQFSNRELQAWDSMFRAAGCTDITPFDGEISPVIISLFYL